MRETVASQCLCQKKPCDCIRTKLVNGRPITLSYPNFTFSSLQALYAHPDSYKNPELYPHVVSSTDQIVPSKKHKIKEEERSSPQGRNRKYICSICSRAFDYKHVLINHARTHTGEKPFECRMCNKKFTRDHHLKTHMRLHTGEKPYKCTHCDKKFVQVANLRRHIRVHTGERPYACNFGSCKSKFADTNQLNAHILTHKNTNSRVDIKPFEKLVPLKPELYNSFPPVGDICTLTTRMIIDPPQDKPEDLSIKNKKHWSVNNNNSSGSAEDSSGSTSPASYF